MEKIIVARKDDGFGNTSEIRRYAADGHIEEPLIPPSFDERDVLPDHGTASMRRQYADELQIVERQIEQFERRGMMIPIELLERRQTQRGNRG